MQQPVRAVDLVVDERLSKKNVEDWSIRGFVTTTGLTDYQRFLVIRGLRFATDLGKTMALEVPDAKYPYPGLEGVVPAAYGWWRGITGGAILASNNHLQKARSKVMQRSFQSERLIALNLSRSQ